MTIYIVLLFIIYITFFFTRQMPYEKSKKDKIFLTISFFSVYLLCVLRDYSIGRDIPGYCSVYEQSFDYGWWDASWIYMEPGYIFLNKLCRALGLSIRQFFCVIYAIMLVPIFWSIKRYSKDVLLSVIIFVCFQFLIFDMTGIRQGLATSVCLLSIPFALRKGIKNWALFACIVLLAMSFHKSAIVFFAAPFLVRLQFNYKSFFLITTALIISTILRESTLNYLQSAGETSYQFNEQSTMDLSLLFSLMLVVWGAIIIKTKNHVLKKIKDNEGNYILGDQELTLFMFFSIVINLLFNGSALLRSSMYYGISILFFLPNIIMQNSTTSRYIYRLAFHVLMIIIFYYLYLVPDNFDIVPYKFGSDLLFSIH